VAVVLVSLCQQLGRLRSGSSSVPGRKVNHGEGHQKRVWKQVMWLVALDGYQGSVSSTTRVRLTCYQGSVSSTTRVRLTCYQGSVSSTTRVRLTCYQGSVSSTTRVRLEHLTELRRRPRSLLQPHCYNSPHAGSLASPQDRGG
jgi:hypothetical protein